MNKKLFVNWIVKNAPHILMGIGTVSGISAFISAIRVTPNALEEYYQAKLDKEERMPSDFKGRVKLTAAETVRASGKFYIPAIGMEILSLACFWSAHGIDMKRQVILAGLYSTAQEALNEYQRKVKELIGKDAEKEVHNALAQDKVDANPPPSTTVILPDDAEQWWIIDGQYFRSTYSKIKEAQNRANHAMFQHMYFTQSELYWLLDPMRLYLKCEKDEGQVGWNVDKLLVLDIAWATDPNHRPVGVIEYRDDDGNRYDPQPGYSAGL